MHLVAFRISAPNPPADPAEAQALCAALKQEVDAYRGAEHVRVHTSRDGTLGVLFLLAPGPAEARAHCLEICTAALAGVPQLSRWRIAGF
ncbi:hypothetical protein [Streptomyces sp. NPDC051561]|uniref:hypothetical protein n=1 Tax=Streptomyces sp. NPDC051561 TaxID=3365658 RepID=UPI00378B4C29